MSGDRKMLGNDETPRILIIHGPNLNMLGQREANWYGCATLEEIDAEIKKTAEGCGVAAETFQSNYEGALVEKIHEALKAYDAVIINPAAYTHTSVAIRDALLMLNVPIIEVHLSNIYRREPFRHKSLIADIVTARIAGFGKDGYMMAVEAAVDMLKRKCRD
jgi:3-dehydroquinate dehydratase-2